MTHLPTQQTEVARFRSFDGGVVEDCPFSRPDRYRMIEAVQGPRIARGGGYSYAAASFGGGSVVLEMGRFNRILRFAPEQGLLEIEAGAKLEDVLAFTAPFGLYLPVQPGYPAITIGGCIAANVHGKNPHVEGTFRRSVVGLTLSNPQTGTLSINCDRHSQLFELTCGGYGLTGVILAATLRLEPLPGWSIRVERTSVGNLAEGLAQIREQTEQSAFAYTWHGGALSPGRFGRGFVYRGVPTPSRPPRDAAVPPYRRLTAASRAGVGPSLFGRSTARFLGTAFRAFELTRPGSAEVSLFDAMFPFARRGAYFLLFGRRGLAEYQSLVPHGAVADFLSEFERAAVRARPPLVMLSLKLFRGARRWLRFEGDGVCFTADLVRSAEGLGFLETLDRLTLAAGGLPHIVKDSRLSAQVVARCYPEYEEFRSLRRAYDHEGSFRSELAVRLGL
jgi:decaprenylphospho-beta-D-ribofuranose 2-oxidase